MKRPRRAKTVRLIDPKGEKIIREKVLDGTDPRDLADHADSEFGEKNTRGGIIEIHRGRTRRGASTFSFPASFIK